MSKTVQTTPNDELVELATRYSSDVLLTQTAIPQLAIARNPEVGGRVHSVHRPQLCFIAQGLKEVTVAGQIYRYGASQYLVSTVDLPITGEVITATTKKPYLCFAILIEPATVFDIVKDTTLGGGRADKAIMVGEDDPEMADAVLRLARCLGSPSDCTILAPAIVREIVYRLLQGPFGPTVRQLGIIGSRTQRIAKAIDHIKTAYTERLEVDALAKLAGMSPSSFHAHFKQVTTLSPLQYQKQLRLQEARRLLLAEATSAADIAFRVGYESPSQFSREYARLFGLPPVSDARQLRANHL